MTDYIAEARTAPTPWIPSTDGHLSFVQTPPADCPAPIAEKLVKLLGIVGAIEKKGHNQQQNYDFVRESDLVDKVRGGMVELGLFLHQTVTSHEMKPLYTTKSGSTMYLTTLGVGFTWVDASGAVWPVPGVFVGYGADTGDKGVYKAATGAEKYFLMKTLLVSTGDDPEGDERVDKHAAAANAARTRSRVRGGNQPGVQRGGQSEVSTDAQRAELKRTAKELGLTTGSELEGLVSDIIRTDYGEEPPTWATVAEFGDWLKRLDAQHMGQLILGAQKRLAAATGTEDTSDSTATPEGDDDLDLD